MSNTPKSASERSYQERFVKELQKFKWDAVEELNGNTHQVTVQTLIDHWRSELNRLNTDELEGIPLTDNEFKQVMSKVNSIQNSYEAAKILAMEASKGKIDGIFRDPNPNITRKQITLTIFKKAEIRGGDSSYRIAREVWTPNENRFDIVLLINGLPLINIEQKRVDKPLNEAFGQFKRYYREGEYTNNFMAFSQMMVINSEIETRYFATPKSINDFNESFVFHWSDEKNRVINNWQEIIERFLMIPMAHQMVGDYLVINEAKDEEDRKHMLMRPYQVYALQKIEGAVFGWDNEDKIPHGGYIWHTTGSGKTITSFKTALFLSTRAGFDNVIFLVDRRELDRNTADNFKAYAKYESVSVDDTKSTMQLKKKLKSAEHGIIVTTTFKLNALVKELEDAKDESLAEKRLIFIIDEAHRTTMGEMMVVIRKYFKRNALFFGFTGTPIFDENKVKGRINEKSEIINTTEKLFGPELHTYTIDEAIADKNVLGFHVDYINTGEFKNYDDLREQMFDKMKEKYPKLTDREIKRKVLDLSKVDLENADFFTYQDETHIPRVVKEILENWDLQSQGNVFNAILTVAYKHRVISYYQEFKKQLEESGKKLNIAMTYSFGNENEIDSSDLDFLKTAFHDYSLFTGIEYSAGDKKRGEDAYFQDVIERAKRGGSGRNQKNIDLIIVAEQLLTGYDSKFLNTLYVDRTIELQNLIQAYSRTNRIFGPEKEFGTIINFQSPATTKQTVDVALKLYGSGGKSCRAIVDTYVVAVEKLASLVPNMIEVLPDPTQWSTLEKDVEKLQAFVAEFRKVAKQLHLVELYYEYKWDDQAFGFTQHEWLQYIGAYKNLMRGTGGGGGEPDIITPLMFRSSLADTQDINANYIVNLIGSKVSSTKGVLFADEETLRIIYEQIQELSNLGEDVQARLLKEFVDTQLLPGNLSSNINFDEAFENWKQACQHNEVLTFAQEWGIDENILMKSLKAFIPSQSVPYIDEISQSVNYNNATKKIENQKLLHTIKLLEEIPKWMKKTKEMYSS